MYLLREGQTLPYVSNSKMRASSLKSMYFSGPISSHRHDFVRPASVLVWRLSRTNMSCSIGCISPYVEGRSLFVQDSRSGLPRIAEIRW